MPFFSREQPLSADFITAPAEPSGADLAAVPSTIDRSKVVAAFNRLAADCRQAGRMDLADRVLDERLIVRPPVPVIPGRPS